jgi:hypothetical protein
VTINKNKILRRRVGPKREEVKKEKFPRGSPTIRVIISRRTR